MAHLIDKDALVAELEKRKRRNILNEGAFEEDIDILSFLNTLEVKEVDLNKEIDNYFDNYKLAKKEECWLNLDQAHIFAKHFFELGIAVSNKAQKGEDV